MLNRNEFSSLSRSCSSRSIDTSSSDHTHSINRLERSLTQLNLMNHQARHHLNQISHHLKQMSNVHLDNLDRSQISRQCSVTESSIQFEDDDQFYTPIEGYETLENRTKFTIYKLKVENIRTGLFWYVYRRYTDFKRLNNRLQNKFTNLNDLILPGKKIFENPFSPLFIERRQLGLQLYLNRLMSNKQLLNELCVRRFLCIDEPPLISNSAFTYQSSVYSTESDQLFTCNNCCLLERKLDEMQLILESQDIEIQKLRNALDNSR